MRNPMVCVFPDDTSDYDVRDENYQSSEEEEREHYCEVCDREFPCGESLQRHMGEHRVCGIDGCVFSAHPKLVEKHISMQHSTGLYQRMKNLSTPEDIAKWIMERKKKYPTKANIEHLKAEAAEKRQRYEVIREKKSVTEIKTSKNEPKRIGKRKNRRKQFTLPLSTKTAEPELYKGVPPFAGTLILRESTSDTEYSLIEDSDNEAETISIEDTSDVCRVDPPTSSSNENNTSSLSLVADYGTDSDKDNGPEEIPFKKIKVDVDSLESEPAAITNQANCGNNNINDNSRTRSQNNHNRNKGKDLNRAKQNDDDSKDEQRGQRFQKNSNDNHNARGRANNGKKIQLLNKLLSKSIQHERNLISQCIKYIVDNNYFE